ncbi:hypothetical protein Ancab_040541 [Ancistrocladus abbreviatus]
MNSVETGEVIRGRGKSKRFWTQEEVQALVESLHELSVDAQWKGENGFKNGYLVRLEEMLHQKVPGCGLKADPHIDSKLRALKRKFDAIHEMLGKSRFGWDINTTTIKVDKKDHKDARGLWGMPFPHYDMLLEVYGSNRANGQDVETFFDAINNMKKSMETQKRNFEFDVDLDEEEFSSTQRKTFESGDSIQVASSSKQSKKQKSFKGKEARQAMDMTSNFNDVAFGTFMKDMNTHLATMANAWSKSQAHEEDMAKKGNKIVNDLLELEGLSQLEVIQATVTLTTEPNKLVIFYQLPPQLRRQYVVNNILHGGPSY